MTFLSLVLWFSTVSYSQKSLSRFSSKFLKHAYFSRCLLALRNLIHFSVLKKNVNAVLLCWCSTLHRCLKVYGLTLRLFLSYMKTLPPYHSEVPDFVCVNKRQSCSLFTLVMMNFFMALPEAFLIGYSNFLVSRIEKECLCQPSMQLHWDQCSKNVHWSNFRHFQACFLKAPVLSFTCVPSWWWCESITWSW